MRSMLLTLLLLGLWYLPAIANTRLGLHVTSDELAIWRTRMVSGPYKTTGDVSANSPGDWDRISTRAESFRASQPAIWVGPANTGCLGNQEILNQNSSQVQNNRIVRDAAFKALLTAISDPSGSTDLKNKVKTWLHSQATVGGKLDFANRTIYCIHQNTAKFARGYSHWLIPLVFAMDYIDILDANAWTAGERTAIVNWFSEAAEWLHESIRLNLNMIWEDRDNNNYSPVVPFPDPNTVVAYMNANTTLGPLTSKFGRVMDNQMNTVFNAPATIVMKFNITSRKADLKKYAQEMIRFSVFPDGSLADFHRWGDSGGNKPNRGWVYATSVVSGTLPMADMLAREGDTSVYDYTTNLGDGYTTNGPPTTGDGFSAKGYLFAITQMNKYIDGQFERYGSTNTANIGNNAYRIHSQNLLSDGKYHQNDFYWIIANNYYKNAYLKSIYMRTAPGAPAYRATSQLANGDQDFQGMQATYPGVMFMFGDMADNQTAHPGLNPYNLTGDTLAPKAPTSPSVTAIYPSQTSVSWIAPTQNTDNSALTDLAGYQILYCAGPSCTPTLTDIPQRPTTPTSYVHTGLQPGTPYSYVIKAVDTTGNHSASSTPTQETQTPPAGLVAHWRMDDGSGTTVDDAVGTLNGTFVGNATPTWPAPGKVGSNALTFDGVNDFVRVSDNAALDFLAAQDFTITMWVRSTQTAALNTWPMLLSKVADVQDDGLEIALHDSNTGTWYAAVYINSVWFPVGNRAGNTCTNIATGAWRHIAVKRQGTTLSAYQDGALCDSMTDQAIDDTLANATDLRLGVWATEILEEYAGDLDDVRIYNSALPDEAIGSLFSTGAVIGLTHWRLHTPGRAENTEWLAAEDQSRTLRQNGRVRIRFGFHNSGSDTSTQPYPLQCRKDQGAYTTLSVIICSGFGVCVEPDAAVTNGQAGTVQLTVPGGTTFAEAAFATDESWPAITLDPAEVGEVEYHVGTSGIAPGVVLCCRPIKGDLTDLDDYPTPPGVPCLTVSAGSGGILSR